MRLRRRTSCEAPLQRVAHVGEVVVAVRDARSEAAVLGLRRATVLEYDHRAHHARALHVAHVVALDPLRRPLETERLLQLTQRDLGLAAVGEPAHTFLFERIRRIAFRELGEMTLLAALRNEQPRGPSAALGE